MDNMVCLGYNPNFATGQTVQDVFLYASFVYVNDNILHLMGVPI